MRLICALVLTLAAVPAGASDVELEWIGHAAFSVRSPLGAKVVVDPYDSNRWVGYRYPSSGVDADAVLVTHAHYDHDATYHFPEGTVVYERPGEYRLHDIRLFGVAGRHAGDHAEAFGNRNTVWLMETGGVRILHTGDNEALSEQALRAIGRADVWLVCVEDEEIFQSFEAVESAAERLGVKVLVPMHYRLEKLSPKDFSMGGIERWLATQKTVRRIEHSLVFLPEEAIPSEREAWVLQPSAGVRKWSGRMTRAWELFSEGKLEAAYRQAPEALPFAVGWGESLIEAGEEERGRAVLEGALLRHVYADREHSMRARLALARLYDRQGKSGRAAEQYRFLLERSRRDEWRAEARKYLVGR